MKAILTQTGLSCIINGVPYTILREHQIFNEAIGYWKMEDEESLEVLCKDVQSGINSYAQKLGAEIIDGEVYLNGKPVHNTLTKRIKEHYEQKLPHQPLLRFLERLSENPSMTSQNELYDFLSNSNIPIDDDGYFYAYKAVKSDYYSKNKGNIELIQGKQKDGYIYNGVGETIECKRQDVDDNRARECSHGLHAGGLGYSGPDGSYFRSGDKVVIVKIDPKDVVSVPRDYNCQKLRTCKYEVISEYINPLPNNLLDEDEDEDEDDLCSFCLEELDECGYCEYCDEEEDEDNDTIDYCDECGRECNC